MAERAAHLVDHVFSAVPVRQWVLTFPHRLRYRLAWDHDLCRAIVGVSVRTVLGFLRHVAHLAGLVDGRSGAVAIVQRFGGAMNLNVHVHALVIDGVFARDGPDVRFRPAPLLTAADIADVLQLRHPWSDGTTHLLFDPLELLERLAVLIPRPRINLILYHGVLGPRAAWRSLVVGFGNTLDGGEASCADAPKADAHPPSHDLAPGADRSAASGRCLVRSGAGARNHRPGLPTLISTAPWAGTTAVNWLENVPRSRCCQRSRTG